jgi:hypothetical protein
MDESSAAALLKRLNAALLKGGSVSIETSSPLNGQEDQPLLGSLELPQRLRDAGFGAVRPWSPQDGLIAELALGNIRESVSIETTLVTGRKVSDYAVWRYAFSVNGMPLRAGGRLASTPTA